MRPDEVISDEDYDTLPDDPELKFARIEQISRRNMNLMIGEDTGRSYDSFVRQQYVRVVLTAAEELGISGLYDPQNAAENEITYDDVNAFQIRAREVCTRLRLRSGRSGRDTVRLGERTRGRIEQQIAILRGLIEAEVTSEKLRNSLLGKLDKLRVELSETRVNLGAVMTVLAAVAACTTISADGPKAVHNIMRLLGVDKAAEEAEVERLGAPPQRIALPAPSRSPLARPSVIDDNIPF